MCTFRLSAGGIVFKKILSLLFLVFGVIFNAYAITCQSNEFEYDGQCIENKFQITTTNDTDKFVFTMTAKGTFYIDWGDGNVQKIERTGTTMTEYSHNYASADEYTIKFGGLATGYSTTQFSSAGVITFGIIENTNNRITETNNTYDKIASISGSLGALFPTLTARPSFANLFHGCTNLTGTNIDDSDNPGMKYAIPPTLFSGVTGSPIYFMFYRAFQGCTNLSGTIPKDLFIGLSGAPTNYVFDKTFSGCSSLSGSIPGSLFSGIVGAPAYSCFNGTFYGCSGLTGTNIDDPNNQGMKYAIPPTLFSGISGKPGYMMFSDTFGGCSGLTGSLPATLFSGIDGEPEYAMFYRTFYNCSGLTGKIPSHFLGVFSGTPKTYAFSMTFYGCNGLTGSIPADLFSGVSGAPATYMFAQTFYGCSGLTGTNIDDPDNSGMKYAIPPNLFGSISGAPAANMYNQTFRGCSGLTGSIPGTLFSGISGAPASGMFYGTFYGCNGLTGSIPADLFSGVSGAPATNMFYQTFYGCNGLTGSISGDLFSGLSGKPAASMFGGTFYKCSNLTGTDIDDPNNPGQKYAIPPTLFAGISGAPATSMFNGTFSTCSKINGTIPGNLFSGIQGRPANAMFSNTFNSCFYLKGQIPGDLFSGIIGKPATNMFYRTFYNDSRLTGSVPPELFAGIDKSTEAADEMYQIFHGTNSMATSCPAGTTQYITGFESYWENRKSCTQCSAEYPLYDFTNDTCYAQVTFIDSDNNTLLKKEDVYYDGNNGSGYNLPSYSPVKPDTILTNWENGSGTVIAANDVLTGNQVVYSDWGFHCDSGKYFHLGNSSQICAAETKRTDHALVINVDPEHTYYIHATPNSEHDYTINSSSIHKMKANYDGTIYNLHDASVYFDN